MHKTHTHTLTHTRSLPQADTRSFFEQNMFVKEMHCCALQPSTHGEEEKAAMATHNPTLLNLKM